MKNRFKKLKRRAEAVFRSVDKSSPGTSPQNNSSSSAAQLPLFHDGDARDHSGLPLQVIVSNPSMKGARSSSLSNNNNITTDQQQPSAMSNITSGTIQLPSSFAVSDSSGRSDGHLRTPSGVSLHRSNDSAERVSRSNETFLVGSDSGELRPRERPRSESTFNQNLIPHNAQSYGNVVGQARQVLMEYPTFYEFHGNPSVNYYGNTSPAVLDRLSVYAMLDATFDSSSRDPPPRCHPGTRLDILQSIQHWFESGKEAQVAWLQGGAGVGKSAIMQTIAEAEAENNALGASIFFSRNNNRDDPRKVFTTIAYQLAVREPSYQQYLAQQIAADPSFLDKSIDRQFKHLIIVPFVQRKLFGDVRGRAILLDGLDECKGNREQCKIVELIHDLVSNHPTVPLRWVIASRPEEHLRLVFSKARTRLQILFWEKEVPVDSVQSVRDVELYLHTEFIIIRDRYPNLTVVHDQWPSETQFLTISRAASGLFVFASTIIRFIDDDENPVHRLNLVLSFLEKGLKEWNLKTNPLVPLDGLYEQILSAISPDTLNVAKLVLGYLVITTYIKVLGEPFWICNILGLEHHAVYGALQKLRSVLNFPEPQDAYNGKVHFLHASFPDYLKDRERSHMYSIDSDESVATYLWRRCMIILQQSMNSHSHDRVEFSWSTENFMKIMSKRIDLMDEKWTLVEEAGFLWQVLLQKRLENNADTAFRILLPLEDMMEQVKQLDFSYPWTISGDSSTIYNFIRCLEQNVPIGLREGIIQDVSITSLSKQQFLESVYGRQWYSDMYNFINIFAPLDFETVQNLGNNLEGLEKFLRRKSLLAHRVLGLMEGINTSQLIVTVIGAQSSKCRVVLRDAHDMLPWYSFPYCS